MPSYYVRDAVTGQYLSAFKKGTSYWDGFVDHDLGVVGCLAFQRKADAGKMITKLHAEFNKMKMAGRLEGDGRIEFHRMCVKTVRKFYPQVV